MTERSIVGKIYDIQGFSVQDGPGIRTTVFLKGCPLRCIWCHSPESQLFQTQLAFIDMKCVGIGKCGRCLDVCPQEAIAEGVSTISPVNGETVRHIALNRAQCVDCGKCAEACYAKALYLCGSDYTIEQIMERIHKDIPFYNASGQGGVTVSGGEPLSQFEFTKELLRACKGDNIHTALDTTGFAPLDSIMAIAPFVNIFLYDIKCMDEDTHKKATGVSNKPILENIRKLAAAGAKFQFRIPIIPGVNNTREEIQTVGEFILSTGADAEMIQLLPYHKYGNVKYERFQQECPMPDEVAPPSDSEMAVYAGIMKNFGFRVSVH
jgi:pyruvate formate lyase activating enzyme